MKDKLHLNVLIETGHNKLIICQDLESQFHSLRSYGQINPLQDYVNEGWAMFRDMLETISLEVVLNLLNVKIQKKVDEKDTYAVNTQAQNDIHKEPAASTEEAKDMKVVTKETGKDLNITDIDKNAKAAVDHEYDDIHTN